MADCKACGAWFGTATPQDLCPTCERALKRLNGYAVPVRHGRWIDGEQYMDEDGFQRQVYCSLCGRYEDEREPYCNCGARMDGEG